VLIVVGSATAAPGRRNELVTAAREVAAATRTDRGCLAYSFAADVENEDRIMSIEIWADRAALDEHMAHGHTEAFLRVAPGLVLGDPVMSSFDVRDDARAT
jgi:quinol monooxygenase YgiN